MFTALCKLYRLFTDHQMYNQSVFKGSGVCRLHYISHSRLTNTRELQTLHQRPAQTYFQLFLATPTDSAVESGTPRHPARSSTVHCQWELLATVENTVFTGRWWRLSHSCCLLLSCCLFTLHLTNFCWCPGDWKHCRGVQCSSV